MDTLRSLRWSVVGVSLILGLAVLFAGRWLVLDRLVETPLSRMLGADPAIVGYTVTERSGERVLRVELRSVPDLGDAVGRITRQLATIPAAPRSVEVVDRRTPALVEVLYRLSPLVHEAMATGRYSLLLPGLEDQGRSLGLDQVRVRVDTNSVYLQLHRGPEYLYEVFVRPDPPKGGRGGGEGR